MKPTPSCQPANRSAQGLQTQIHCLAFACVLALGVASPAQAAPYDGQTAATAGLSAAQILRDHPSSTTGIYWIDPDGAGGAAAQQLFADMRTDGGGWMLVRHATNTGGWINVTDSLTGTAALNTAQATNPLSTVDWTVPFNNANGQFLFMTGDTSTWGVLASADVYQHVQGDLFAPNATVLASFNTAIAAGGMTNVLNRNNTGSGLQEDPWIGFEGGHVSNINKMLYGEAGFASPSHSAYKNAHLGVNVFIRETLVPTTPVPEPATWLMWMAAGGWGLLRTTARRRSTKI